MRIGKGLSVQRLEQLFSLGINLLWYITKNMITMHSREEALRKNRYDDHKEENGGVKAVYQSEKDCFDGHEVS